MRAKEKQLNMLGLAQRAGKLISGDELVVAAITLEKAIFVLCASDASENTQKKFKNKCESYGVPLNLNFTKYEISHAIGKSRTIVAMTDSGMAKKFLSYSVESEEFHE